tara:strand:+ start:587 stop:793 length:207 start_codon:yes stop_codon:yes gene_type:complete
MAQESLNEKEASRFVSIKSTDLEKLFNFFRALLIIAAELSTPIKGTLGVVGIDLASSSNSDPVEQPKS